MAKLKNIRIAVSGIYEYALEEIPSLDIPNPREGAPNWVEVKNIYKVYRPAPILATACKKFSMLPLTHHHPQGTVNGSNFRNIVIGFTGENPYIDFIQETNEVGIRSTCMLYDDEALNAYENGEVQLSPGYVAVFEWEQGTAPNGEKYDIIMREIVDVNHVALLPAGRGGKDAAVLDGAPEGNDNASKEHTKEEDVDSYPEKNYPEYKGQGQKAVDFLIKNKSGQVKGAFNREEIGDIDIVWGEVIDKEDHLGYGLSHIIEKHGKEATEKIGDIVENGNLRTTSNGRIAIEKDGFIVAIRRTWNGNKKTWIVTGVKKEQDNSTTPSSANDYTVETLPKPKDTMSDNYKSVKSIFDIVSGSVFERVAVR